MVSLGSRGVISPSQRKNYSLLLCNTRLRHIFRTLNFCIHLHPKTSLSELYKHKSLCFSLWLCCIREKMAWPDASEWTIVNQLLQRGVLGHGNPLGSVRAGGKKRRDSPAGSLAPWEASRRGSSFSLCSAALKFQLGLAEPRVVVKLSSHKGNTSGLYQILLPFHSSLPSSPSHSLFPRIEFSAANIIFSKEIVLKWTNKYIVCHCYLLLKVLTAFWRFHFSDVTFLWS